MNNSCGVFFIATGGKCCAELQISIRQLRKHMSNIPIAVASEKRFNDCDHFILIEKPTFSFADKVQYMRMSPFGKTIFFDSDTFLLHNVLDLYLLLSRVDIAAPIAPIDEEICGVPDCFPEFNTGIIAYNKNSEVNSLLLEWERNYMMQHQNAPVNDVPPDQLAFRESVYKSNIRFSYLPLEYNCMTQYPIILQGKTRLLHGHHTEEEFKKYGVEVNVDLDSRIRLPGGKICKRGIGDFTDA